jgi:hypothetical protein
MLDQTTHLGPDTSHTLSPRSRLCLSSRLSSVEIFAVVIDEEVVKICKWLSSV